MVGALRKSRSSVESCWFSDRTIPRLCGEDLKTLNHKEQCLKISLSRTVDFIA